MESSDSAVAVGTLVRHKLGFREFSLCSEVTAERLDIQDESPSAHLGVLGMTGLTAYAGMLIVAALKEGERVFVLAQPVLLAAWRYRLPRSRIAGYSRVPGVRQSVSGFVK